MNKILKALIPSVLALSLLIPTGISVSANTTDESKAVNTQQTKRVVTYFPNWAFYPECKMGNLKVKDIAWDKVTQINHGFWEINSNCQIQSFDPWADFQTTEFDHGDPADWDKYPNTGIGGNLLAGHFAEYKFFKQKNPNVKVLISVGGWTRSNMFHETAKNEANRAKFAQSLVDTLKKYPFIDGFDLDWEYPCIPRDPEITSDMKDMGNPAGPEDKENFTLLLKDSREKLNASGMKDKMLTVAVSAGEEKIKNTEPDKYYQYVDYIGVMTYDFAGDWDKVTGNLAGINQNPLDKTRPKFNVDDAMKIFRDEYKVPANKLLAGTPLYSRGWGGVEPGPNGDGFLQPATGSFVGNTNQGGLSEGGGQYLWWGIKNNLEKPGSGWEKFRDPFGRTPYLYNKTTKQFISYEDEYSLKARCNYVNDNNFGGLIVWDASGDDINAGNPMQGIMYDAFVNGKYYDDATYKVTYEYNIADVNHDLKVDAADLSLAASKYNLQKNIDADYDSLCDVNSDLIIDIYDLVKIATSINENVEPEYPNDTWDSTIAYPAGGTIVIYKGVKYKNQWYASPGEVPGVAGVWVKVE